jgi:hypothetical protein
MGSTIWAEMKEFLAVFTDRRVLGVALALSQAGTFFACALMGWGSPLVIFPLIATACFVFFGVALYRSLIAASLP